MQKLTLVQRFQYLFDVISEKCFQMKVSARKKSSFMSQVAQNILSIVIRCHQKMKQKYCGLNVDLLVRSGGAPFRLFSPCPLVANAP